MDRPSNRTHRLSKAILTCALAAFVAGDAETQEMFNSLRMQMVDEQIRRRGVAQPELLNALESVPRHLFVPESHRTEAYDDNSVPIGGGEFISQPYLSARMIELLELDGSQKVLEIGTGSGYDAAIISQLAKEVYTVEISQQLADQARASLRELGYDNVYVRVGNGYEGWPQEAPFDAIIFTAAPPNIPMQLLEQLEDEGRMVVPVGEFLQDLVLITKTPDGSRKRKITPIRLGPMRDEEGEDATPLP